MQKLVSINRSKTTLLYEISAAASLKSKADANTFSDEQK